ncbi:hypothetical protein [Bacillus sp. FJAT-52991]|uniref:Uncharacterized protein n=1 Tax=Bacillus kandeliae TaxID=3129297 RepID=A0ABZ2NB43_9BACI
MSNKQQDIFNKIKGKTGANAFVQKMNEEKDAPEETTSFEEFIKSLSEEEAEMKKKKRVNDTHVSHTVYIDKELKEAMDLLAGISERGWKTRFLNGLIRNGLKPYAETLERLNEAKKQEEKLKQKLQKDLEKIHNRDQ